MSTLTKNEEILLVAIWRLKEKAYGVKIRKNVAELTGKTWNYGTLYCSLDQLVKKNFAVKTVGEPLPERGGRRKIYYNPTPDGVKALQNAHKLQKALWEGITDISFEESQIV